MKGDDNERKIEFYWEAKKVIHISCNSGRFYNGTILEINYNKRFVIFIDNKIGEVPILFEEIKHIEPFTEKEELV